jgi:hypothetical protein
VILLYLSGLLVAGVRVIEVPGYGRYGYRIQIIGRPVAGGMELVAVDPQTEAQEANPAPGTRDVYVGWALKERFVSEIASKPWFAGQILAGPLCLVSAAASNRAAQGDIGRPHAPLDTVGTLYTAIAGMLNLMVIIDATHRAGNPSQQSGGGSA